MEEPQVFDQQGKKRTWAWLTTNFGAISLERTQVPEGQTHAYRIVKLQDAQGPAVQIVNVVDQEWQPHRGHQRRPLLARCARVAHLAAAHQHLAKPGRVRSRPT